MKTKITNSTVNIVIPPNRNFDSDIRTESTVELNPCKRVLSAQLRRRGFLAVKRFAGARQVKRNAYKGKTLPAVIEIQRRKYINNGMCLGAAAVVPSVETEGYEPTHISC